MKISGTSMLTSDRAQVWAALNDPSVLVATIPGCQRLEALGADAYRMTVAAGVGSIKGVYDGEVRLSDHEEPSAFRLHAQGAGAPGTIGAEVLVRLENHPGGGTVLSYDAEAIVGGMIGGVGQRMLSGVSRKLADEFFRNVDAALAQAAAGAPAAAGEPGPSGPSTVAPAPSAPPSAPPVSGVTGAAGASPVAGTVFTAPGAAAATRGAGGTGFVLGVAAGAVAALAGVVVGAWVAGRRSR